MKNLWYGFVIALGVCSSASAAVFKCKTPEGETIYQQIPCAADQREEQVQIYRGPSQEDVARAQARLHFAEAEKAAKERARLQQALDNALMPGNSGWQESNSNPYADQSSDQPQSPCPPGQIPLNPSSHDPSQGWSSGKGYEALRCGDPNARRAPPPPERSGPQRFQDQHGNWYSQPPGSGFARDERTGKQCLMSGTVIVRCD